SGSFARRAKLLLGVAGVPAMLNGPLACSGEPFAADGVMDDATVAPGSTGGDSALGSGGIGMDTGKPSTAGGGSGAPVVDATFPNEAEAGHVADAMPMGSSDAKVDAACDACSSILST